MLFGVLHSPSYYAAVLVIPFRRFGATYRFHFQGPRIFLMYLVQGLCNLVRLYSVDYRLDAEYGELEEIQGVYNLSEDFVTP